MKEVYITCTQDPTKKLDDAPKAAQEFYRRQWKPGRACTFIYPEPDALAFIEEGHNNGYFQDLKRDAGIVFTFKNMFDLPLWACIVCHNLGDNDKPEDFYNGEQMKFIREYGLDREGYRFYPYQDAKKIEDAAEAVGLETSRNDIYAGTCIYIGQFETDENLYPGQ